MVAGDVYDKVVTERYALEADLARDRASIIEYRHAADKECASGEGSRCRGARSSVAFYENSAKGSEARLKLLETPKPVDASAEAFGNLAAALGFDKVKARALSMLIMPYLVTLFFEFGTTISLGYAFSPKRQPKQLLLPKPTKPIEAAVENTSEPKCPNSEPPNNPNRRMTRDEVLSELMLRAATSRGFGSQDEAARHYGVSPSRFSEWSKAWEDEGSLPRRMVGRCKTLA